MLGITGNGEQRFAGDAKENVIDHFLVVESECGNLFRQSEDDMEILDRQKLRLAGLEPLCAGQRLAFGTMPIPARVVANADFAALAAFIDVMAQHCGTTGGDGIGGPALLAREQMLLGKVGISKNVGQFQSGPGHAQP